MTMSGLAIFCGRLGGGIGGANTCVLGIMKLLSLVLDLTPKFFWSTRGNWLAMLAKMMAVLTGAFVSPQMRTRQGDNYEEKCPWCSGGGNFHHVSWECQKSPVLIYRPPIPHDPLTCRFGWGDERVLKYLAAVRDLILEVRYSC